MYIYIVVIRDKEKYNMRQANLNVSPRSNSQADHHGGVERGSMRPLLVDVVQGKPYLAILRGNLTTRVQT